MTATREDHPLWQRAAAQTPAPTSATALSLLLGTLLQLRIGRPAVQADDVSRRAQGLPYVTSSNAGGSRADLLVNPDTRLGVRVGFDLPAQFCVPTLPRFGSASQLGAGVT